ncbi:putative Myb/SANT-like domain, harbinger transposase-derived nuclease domain-containing protein [Helianthus annuus]|uniref:Myb/SANT-like domain, harbinger transposase-derived nuclease domain-containing protein n=1 Tax=Helianthus annuus TaxID=4232 RepID=A0A9K3IDX4_HELAN|nr:putative Myb/SANT-like domain, harbinger transposase-derived nuclease domain-containing protein [Helianthus annuus]
MDLNHENATSKLSSTKASARKTVWDSSTHMIFDELCLEEVKNGIRPASHFNKVGWTNLANNLKTRTGKDYTKLQLKNHWDSMKRDWKLYDRLMRIESGLGWDPVKKTINSTSEMEIPNYGKYVNSDSEDENNDSNEEDWLDDEKRFLLLCGLVVKGVMVVHNMMNIPRIPCRTSCRTGNIFIQEILNGHPRRCFEDFRVHVDVYKSLCSDLRMHYNLKETRNVSIEEFVGIFLLILAHGCGNRLAQEIFNHSGETIHRHFHHVLRAVLKLSGDIIMPKANYNNEVPPQLLNNSRYYPMFKDCIGAIDGTHVKASVREHEQAKYIGRKGYATQNIMAACDFNMCFTFAWAGWEGTAHDTRIFLEALRKPEVKFPRPTGDKYYVVDAGYPNTRGYLAPYKGNDVRYHIPDFRRGQTAAQRAPKGLKETFNYYHSSLRNVIERTFGVWKARWAILKDMHVNYSYETQVDIVIASMAIHNYIRMKGHFDEAFNKAQQEIYRPTRDVENDTSIRINGTQEDITTRRRQDDLYMSL